MEFRSLHFKRLFFCAIMRPLGDGLEMGYGQVRSSGAARDGGTLSSACARTRR